MCEDGDNVALRPCVPVCVPVRSAVHATRTVGGMRGCVCRPRACTRVCVWVGEGVMCKIVGGVCVCMCWVVRNEGGWWLATIGVGVEAALVIAASARLARVVGARAGTWTITV